MKSEANEAANQCSEPLGTSCDLRFMNTNNSDGTIPDSVWDALLRMPEDNLQLVRSNEHCVELRENESFWYPIDLDRCDTHFKILSWVKQLSSKAWITPEQIDLFISHALYRHPRLSDRSAI